MTAEACFECDDRKVILFYLHVESLVNLGYIPFGDFTSGGVSQVPCPYCCDEDPFTAYLWAPLLIGGKKDA